MNKYGIHYFLQKRPKRWKQTRKHRCNPNINLIERESEIIKIIIPSGTIIRISSTILKLFNNAELLLEEEKT